MEPKLSFRELAAQTGEPESRLREWQHLGLIGSRDSDEYESKDIERAHLLRMFLGRGFSNEQVARSVRDGELRQLLPAYLDARFPGAGHPAYSLEEAAERAGLDFARARLLWNAAFSGQRSAVLNEDDVQLLASGKLVLEAGLPEEALLQILRVWGDNLRRVADVTWRLAHFYMRDWDDRGRETGAHDRALSIQPLIEPSVLYFLRKGMLRAQREDLAMHLAEEVGLWERAGVPGQFPAAVLFTDLASFTPLTETMGDLRAAQVLERFASLVHEAAGRWGGEVVKQIGDAFLLIFYDPDRAVACALEIEQDAVAEPLFPAVRCGIHWGPVLYREGDYVGATVNVAARVVEEADRHQVLVTGDIRHRLDELNELKFVLQDSRTLKGVAEEIALYDARRAEAADAEKVVDPVCGMELGPSEIAARLSLGHGERAFCSEECLRRFVAAPEKYGGADP